MRISQDLQVSETPLEFNVRVPSKYGGEKKKKT